MKLKHPFQTLLWTVLLFKIYLFFLFSKVEPDPYHDGFIYAPAVGVADGLLPNRDFFAQYGPVSPLIQGVWLWITSPTILNLKILNCIFVALTAIVIVQILKTMFCTELAQLISIAWVSWFAASMPWPSVITTLFTLIALQTLLIQNRTNRNWVFLGSFLLALAVFTRIQSVLFLIVLIPLYYFEKDLGRKSVYKAFLLSGFAFLTIGMLIMGYLDMFSHYIEQSIIWSSQAYAEVELSKSFFTSFVWFPVSFLALVLLIYSIRSISTKIPSFLIVPLLVLILFSLNQIQISGNVSLSNPRLLMLYATRSILHLIGYASVFCIVLLACYWAIKAKGSKNLEGVPILASSWGVLVLGQLWPLHDDIHVWFISPILVVSAIYGLPADFFNRFNFTRPFAILLVAIIFVNSIQNIKFLSIDRVPYKNFGMVGLFGDAEKVNMVDTSMELLEIASALGPYRNQCTHGLYAIVKGRYVVTDGAFAANSRSDFVTWYPTGSSSQGFPAFTFYCGLSFEQYSKIKGSRDLLYSIGNKLELKESNSFNVLYRGVLPSEFLHD
jgi:hypothetical protein